MFENYILNLLMTRCEIESDTKVVDKIISTGREPPDDKNNNTMEDMS